MKPDFSARFLRQARKFGNDEDGSTTIEAVLWIPMFAFLTVMIADASFIFYGRAQAMRLIQDGNRAYSVGRLENAAATSTYIATLLSELSPNAMVTTTVSGGIVTSSASIPVDDLVAFGSIPSLNGFTTIVRSQHYLEY